MSYPPILGLHGVAGAGKDTTFDRLHALGGDRFQRFSIADPMKESIAALLGLSLERLEELKRNEHAGVVVLADMRGMFADMWELEDDPITMREFMQRYGTEAHRDIFGDDFWLSHWLQQVDARNKLQTSLGLHPAVFVNTSVRFPNEAQAILDRGGEVWSITGPQDDGAAGHESETPLPPELVTRYVDNSIRSVFQITSLDGKHSTDDLEGRPDHSHLDDQVATILSEWRA